MGEQPQERSTPTPATLPVAIGDMIAGKYRIERVLGSSGMGIVYAAMHVQMDTRVAVKFLLTKSEDHDTLVRFEREAKFTAKIRNEHVVRVLDVGHIAANIPFIVMEYLDGHDLAREAAKGPMPIDVAVDFLLQASEGLQAAHEAGIVHRDIKPSNLFLTKMADRRAIVKVIDFGVAKYRGVDTNPEQQNESLTSTSLMIGSPRYMAPEQVRASRDVDSRADVWSLGVILYEFLAGKPAFKGPSLSDSIVLILTADPPRVELQRPDIPQGLADVIASALEKDPERRTPTVAAFARALLPFATTTRRVVLDEVFRHESWPVPPRRFDADTSGSLPQMPAAPRIPDDVATRTTWDGHVNRPHKSRVALVSAIVGAAVVVLGVAGAAGAHYLPRMRASANTPLPTNVSPRETAVEFPRQTTSPIPTPTINTTIQVTPPPASQGSSPAALVTASAAVSGKKVPPPPPPLRGGPGPAVVAQVTHPPVASAAPQAAPEPPPPPPPENKGNLFDDPK